MGYRNAHGQKAGRVIRSRWTLDHYRDLNRRVARRRLTPWTSTVSRASTRFLAAPRRRAVARLSGDDGRAREGDRRAHRRTSCASSRPIFTSEAAVDRDGGRASSPGPRRQLPPRALDPTQPQSTIACERWHNGSRPCRPLALTFHAPGRARSRIWPPNRGAKSCIGHWSIPAGRYFSDSTGRWRWGHPGRRRTRRRRTWSRSSPTPSGGPDKMCLPKWPVNRQRISCHSSPPSRQGANRLHAIPIAPSVEPLQWERRGGTVDTSFAILDGASGDNNYDQGAVKPTA